jgi:hypothetical protein
MPEDSQNPIFSLLRADDMLALTFELVNLVLDTTQTPPQLIHSQPGPAFVIVHFPPQHIAERVFDENETGQPTNLDAPPVQSTLADPTRLAFQVPDTTQSIPFTLQNLLDWTQFDLQVAPNALPDGTTLGPGLRAPLPQETAVEVPYRLILSPDRSAGWKHAVATVTRGDRTELWHTRLGVRNRGGSGVDESRLPAVRAIWARDMDPAIPTDLPDLVPSGAVRRQIAQLSSDFTMPRDFTRPSGGNIHPADPLTPIFFHPPALETHRLMLSALGAWTDVAGFWDFPNPNPAHDFVPNAPTFALAEWAQLVSMGRDQSVRVALRGFCCPFGHRAVLVEEVHRKLELAPSGLQTDYLIRRSFIIPQEPVKDYTISDITDAYRHKLASGAIIPSQGREMPFKRVRLTTLITPALDELPRPPDPLPPPPDPLQPAVPPLPPLLLSVDRTPFRFHYIAEDCEGQNVDFSLPVLFVTLGTDADAIATAYNGQDSLLRTAELRNQIVAFASPPQPGAAHLKTDRVAFTVQPAPSLSPSFLPEMQAANVSVPAVDHLLGSSGKSGATVISFHDAYLQNGFDPGNNAVQAFAKLATSPLNISLPADKAGGLVTPSMDIDGLTCTLGPVAKIDSLVRGDLQAFRDSLDGNLLGGITLKQVIDAVTGGPIESIKSQVPALLTTQSADAIETSFKWHPRIVAMGNPSPPLVTVQDPNNPDKSTSLDISVVTRAPLGSGDPTFTVDGILSNFALNFFNIVLVTFDQLHFHAEPTKKVDVNPRGVNVEFIGELSLLNRLAELLPPGGFSDSPGLDVRPDGITAGYTLGIPAAGIGAFSLENIAIAAQLSLPSANPVKLRLAFSERFHPFLVTVSLVGGGGFLVIEADAHGGIAVEGSLELGGNITISLGIVEANAHVMMGFHFRINSTDGGVQSEFIFYIRIGASVDLLGLVSVSIDLYLGLTFTPKFLMNNPPPGVLGVVGGVAALVIGVHLLFSDKSFTLSFERHFDIPARAALPLVGSVSLPILSDPSFDEMVSEADWQTYCQAFA